MGEQTMKLIKSEYKIEKMSLEDYLSLAKKDPSVYASAAERMLKAIGEPRKVDTSKADENGSLRKSRIFGNRTIRVYDAFKDFYGLEDVVSRIVSFFQHAAQNLEESRQILYLLGPVGSAKSSLVERLKSLMEKEPIYILADKDGNPSPINESPLSICGEELLRSNGIKVKNLVIPSPWATKRLKEYKGDLSKFTVIKRMPSQLEQVAISKTEPGDENNQDISALVGKVDIRKLEHFSQNDPDAYSYCGGLCLSNQGMLEFVEMFKAPIKMLHPLLTATQEKNYKGTEAISAIPFQGVIVAHSNESEWDTFKNNKNNEAFLDRVYSVEVPYCLHLDDEQNIYKKLISSSTLENAPIAPYTLELLAQFSVLTRLEEPENSNVVTKMRVYNGENVKEKDSKAKSYQEYKDTASADEGFFGVSTRLAYKILAEVYNFDHEEIAADPVHLLYVLEKTVENARLPNDTVEKYLDYIKGVLVPYYAHKVGKDIQTAYLDSYQEFGQALFDRYIMFADHWVQDNDYRDPDTGQMFDREMLNKELEKIEKPAEIANPKDFRHEVVNYALRYQASNKGNNPKWTAYEKLKRVIEFTMFSKTKDLLPVISFGGQGNKEDKKKHESFIARMIELGYTERQTRRIVEWHSRIVNS
jgi:serine protein kinase